MIFSKHIAVAAIAALALIPASAVAGDKIANDLSKCGSNGPAVLVNITGLKSASGTVRAQTYRAISSQWLKSGRWLTRVEVPVTGRSMKICLPVAASGNYAVAVRHDANANGKSDRSDGGGFSNNPDISLLNMKPSVSKTAFSVGNGTRSIRVVMNYLQGTSIEPLD